MITPIAPRRAFAPAAFPEVEPHAPSASASAQPFTGAATRCPIDLRLRVAVHGRHLHHRDHQAGKEVRSFVPASIVRPVSDMRIRAQKEVPAMPTESGLVQLQDDLADQRDRIVFLDAYVARVAADGLFTPDEFAEFRKLSTVVLVQQEEVGRTVGFLADAWGLIKTVLHVGAITPWAARQARERSEDRLRLLATPVNVIPFRRPEDFRVS